jgi:hypothetical protein
MTNIIGNKLNLVIEEKALKGKTLEDTQSTKQALLEKLQKSGIARNRLSGLLRNSYKLSIDELALASQILETKMEDLLMLSEPEKTAPEQ